MGEGWNVSRKWGGPPFDYLEDNRPGRSVTEPVFLKAICIWYCQLARTCHFWSYFIHIKRNNMI